MKRDMSVTFWIVSLSDLYRDSFVFASSTSIITWELFKEHRLRSFSSSAIHLFSSKEQIKIHDGKWWISRLFRGFHDLQRHHKNPTKKIDIVELLIFWGKYKHFKCLSTACLQRLISLKLGKRSFKDFLSRTRANREY